MPGKFIYKARDLTGRLVNGQIEAENQGEAIALLRTNKFFVVEITPAQTLEVDIAKLLGLKIKLKDLALFCRQFATMQEASVPLIRCLNILIQQTENKNLRKILQEVGTDVEKGQSLSESFKRHMGVIPDIFINMIAAGEASGTIDQALNRLATHFDKEYELREKVKSAMTYPVLIAGVAFISMIILMVMVVPVFTDIFIQMGATLPLPTRILIGVSTLFTNYWHVLPIAGFVLAITARYSIKTKKGKEIVDRLVLRLPIIGPLTHKTIISRFARTLSTLLKSGVSFLQSFETVKKVVNNSLVKKEILDIEKNVREGERIAPLLLKSKIFPPMAVNMMAIGEESGSLDDLLEKIAIFYDREIETMVTRMSSLIEPFLILGVGAMIGFIALSIYLPLFGMAGAMQGGGGMP